MKIPRLAVAATLLIATSAVATAGASTTTIYDATGGAENGGDNFGTGGRILLDQVQNVSAGTLTSVVLKVKSTKTDLGSFSVILTAIAPSGKPKGPDTVVATVADKTLTSNFATITVSPTAPISLLANTAYYVGIKHAPGGRSSVVLGNTVDPAVLARPTVVTGKNYYNSGGVQANAGGPYEIAVVTTPTGP